MLLFVDECLPERLVRALRGRGHDVTWARETCPGANDEFVLALATREGRVVLTEDRDFGTLTMRLLMPALGVVIIHMSELPGTLDEITLRVTEAIDNLANSMIGTLTTIEPGRIRQRTLPSRT